MRILTDRQMASYVLISVCFNWIFIIIIHPLSWFLLYKYFIHVSLSFFINSSIAMVNSICSTCPSVWLRLIFIYNVYIYALMKKSESSRQLSMLSKVTTTEIEDIKLVTLIFGIGGHKTNTNTILKSKTISNMDLTKRTLGTQLLAQGKQFL